MCPIRSRGYGAIREFTGTEQVFQVPAGVTSVHVIAVGGYGGGSIFADPFAPGARPDRIEADLPVGPGQLLFIEVGGAGGKATDTAPGAGGFNGGGAGGSSTGISSGGGGGGASDVRTVSRINGLASLQSRLLVAGGGGGMGGSSGTGAPGGDAGKPGANGAGESGFKGSSGGGATAAAPGAGGASDAGFPGQAGSPGAGGNGATVTGKTETYGGGGGGAFGGGGGGAAQGPKAAPGGGGGGSSAFGSAAANPAIESGTSAMTSVTLIYTVGAGPGPGPGPGSVPQTTLRFRPPKLIETAKRKVGVQFRFAADVPGSTFLCKLDKRKFSACSSPKRYRVGAGATPSR